MKEKIKKIIKSARMLKFLGKFGLSPLIKHGDIIGDSVLLKIESRILGYSKFLMTLSTGAIVLSFTILNTFEQIEDLKFPLFLIISWFLFGFSIWMGLVFDNSLLDFKIKLEKVNNEPEEERATRHSQENWDSFNSWGTQADFLQRASFLSAILSLVFFVIVNFYQYSNLLNNLAALIRFYLGRL